MISTHGTKLTQIKNKLQNNNLKDVYWRSHGLPININKMESKHLSKALYQLKDSSDRYINGYTKDVVVLAMVGELERRRLVGEVLLKPFEKSEFFKGSSTHQMTTRDRKLELIKAA